MKVDLDTIALDNRRTPVPRQGGDVQRDEDGHAILTDDGLTIPVYMTIGDLFIDSLADIDDADRQESTRARLERGRLSDLIYKGGMIDLTPRDVALLQKRAEKLPTTGLLRVVEVLGDPDAESKPVECDGGRAAAERPAV